MHTLFLASCNFVLISSNRYETSAAIIETETSTAELAQEVRNHATQAQFAAKEAALTALIAEVTHRPYPHSYSCARLTIVRSCTGPTTLAGWRSRRRGHHYRRSRRSAANNARNSTGSARDGRIHKGRGGARRIHSSRALTAPVFSFLVDEVLRRPRPPDLGTRRHW